MRKLVGLCCVLIIAFFAAAGAESETSLDFEVVDEQPPLPDTEPITGTDVMPAPGSESVQKDPFLPYDIGDPASAIPYEALTADEQAVVDRDRDVSTWRGVHDAYGAAVAERAKEARANAAAAQLGISDLATEGVVP